LKPKAGGAGAQVIPSQFLEEFFVAMHDAVAATDMGFGRISPSSVC